MEFNPAKPTKMHIDINSCFATIEQQANPLLRNRPVAVAAYTTGSGCILAASVEAKRIGIKTGMPVYEGKKICPWLKVLPPDPRKYRSIHLKLKNLISDYTDDFSPKSIDEFVLNLENYPILGKKTMCQVALIIKKRIKKEIGEWITVSVGIAPNRYLAKIGAGLKKPDGLTLIDKENFLDIYSKIKLTDLTGIKNGNGLRLNALGIYSVLDFYNAPLWRLRAAFKSITGVYWKARLAGWEVDNVDFSRKSFGNSTAIGVNLSNTAEIAPILSRLVEKMSSRLRGAGFKAKGIHLAVTYKNNDFWHKGKVMSTSCFEARDFYKAAFGLLNESQQEKNPRSDIAVLNIAVSCFALEKLKSLQLDFFSDREKIFRLSRAEDFINQKWGDFSISSARSLNGSKFVMDRIAFGGVRDLE